MYKPALGLTVQELNRIKKIKPLLLKTEPFTSVPWEAIAAIWYRESFSVASPKTPGGPFQFDPVPSGATLQKLLQRFTPLSDTEIARYVSLGVDSFEAGALFAACWLRTKVKPVISLSVSDEIIKEAFYGYNGRAYGSSDQSPYVMNGYDAAHLNMVLRGTIPDGNGGRRKIQIMDKRPGAFTVYKQLKSVNY